ncbi:class I SAM-dependent methyltransferase [Maribacter chungangensis]|uniref:Class I SAM-dependent methyltransferase n=1 Tax=Maribacter chungangensis TaxID=1069117 RepID=A0ABW3AZY1_9FLAO
MATSYDKITAFHYASYRPSLHEPILRACLDEKKFKHGLDIGCGTGVSSIALKKFCDRVSGVDPNEKMIAQTVTKNTIDYQLMMDKNLPFPDSTFDICTYAGSWWYGKSQALLDETIRVSTPGATILLYDFELDFKNIHEVLGLVTPDLAGYEHDSNFNNLDTAAINAISQQKGKQSMLLSPTEIAHLLCSEKPIYDQLILTYNYTDVFRKLVDEIKTLISPVGITITAFKYYSLYRLEP